MDRLASRIATRRVHLRLLPNWCAAIKQRCAVSGHGHRAGVGFDALVAVKRRGGRKLVLAPDGVTSAVAANPVPNDTMLKLLIKAHRRRIGRGKAKSITDLAAQENVSEVSVRRPLLPTCLAPDITATILDESQPRGLRTTAMLKHVALAWDEQREVCGFPAARNGSDQCWLSLLVTGSFRRLLDRPCGGCATPAEVLLLRQDARANPARRGSRAREITPRLCPG